MVEAVMMPRFVIELAADPPVHTQARDHPAPT
jgi:hypothetical protein